MKKLGLIGGTGPESTIVYYRELTQGVQKRLGRAVFPPLCIDSLSVFELLDFCEKGEYDRLADYLLAGLRNLSSAGAEVAALTGITAHIVFDQLSQRSPIPIVSMVDTACAYAAGRGYTKIALLGTLPTMNGTFFQQPFLKKGIEVVTPTESEKAYIGEKIAAELEYGTVLHTTKLEMTRIAQRLIAEEQVQAVVLGCTELPLLFDQVELPVEKLDVMHIHIEALIGKILE